MAVQRPSTPPYVIRESTRINQLESTVQQMASDLTSSKEQIKEVKELLLRLINPATPSPPHASPHAPSQTGVHQQLHSSPVRAVRPLDTPPNGPINEANPATHVHPITVPQHPVEVAGGTPHVIPNCQVGIQTDALKSPSWGSGDTVPVTPNTMLQNFTNRMPVGAAVSTEVSASIGTASHDMSPPPSFGNTSMENQGTPDRPSCTALRSLTSTGELEDGSTTHDGVATRRMTSQGEAEQVRVPRTRFELTLQPRFTSHALAANSLCYILHPDHGNTVIGEGQTGGSWKCRSGKFGNLCSEGEQMLQIHKVIKTGLPLIFHEQRQPFTTMDQAIVKPSGSSIYVKWQTRLLWSRKKM